MYALAEERAAAVSEFGLLTQEEIDTALAFYFDEQRVAEVKEEGVPLSRIGWAGYPWELHMAGIPDAAEDCFGAPWQIHPALPGSADPSSTSSGSSGASQLKGGADGRR